VVAFADGGIPEVVANGTSGCLVQPFDGTAFTAAISRLLREPALRREMGRAATDYVRRRHDLNQNYRVVEQILIKLSASIRK
jgi:glycosyltransferase involved in cell wall biosynthesis